MNRDYNHNISKKANDWLYKRERTVRLQKRMIAIVSILAISMIILLGSSIRIFANSNNDETVYKYYTSIRLENGDTLWDIANTYTDGLDIDKKSYIEEICKLNNIKEDEIHSGEYITIVYYSIEEK